MLQPMEKLRAIAANPVVQGLLICLLICVIYSNTLHSPMQFDDNPNIVDNPTVKDLRYLANPKSALIMESGQYLIRRYVGYLSFALNYRFHQLEVEGYHVVNIAIHAMCAMAVFWFVWLIFQTPRGRDVVPRYGPLVALSAALLFAAHPLQTQAVTYIVQRFTSLMALFYLLALAMYLKGRMSHGKRARWGWIAGAIACTVVSMRTKENAFTIPFAIALMEWAFFAGSGWRRWLLVFPFALTLPIIPLWLGGSIGVSEMSDMTRLQSPLSRHEYFFTELRVLATYLRLLVLPLNQNIDYDYPMYKEFFVGPVMASALLLLALLSVGVALLRTPMGRVGGFGIMFFFLAISVESSFVPIADVIFEHRMYLPGVGLILAACALGFGAIDKPRVVLAVVLALAMVLSVATYRRNEVWRSNVSLWQDAVSKSPDKGRPLASLVLALEASGQSFEAMSLYRRAIELNPDAPIFLGGAYLAMGQLDMALAQYQRAVELEPLSSQARSALGAVYIEMGMFERGVNELKISTSINPDNAYAYYHLGRAYSALDNSSEAIAMFERALYMAPPSKADGVRRALEMERAKGR